jgi:NAD(P)-dependent dehydrogenase (short-subunit alcohol dehydrogenase family)
MSMGLVEQTVAVVIGGTSGIGARTAELLADEGACVLIAGRRRAEGEALAQRLGSPAAFVSCDVLVESDLENLVALARERFGRIDALINCAGDAAPTGGIADVDLGRFQRTLAVHLGGTIAAMKHVAPVMLEQGSGSIVNVASIGGRFAGWTGLGYAAAKAAVIQVTRCAAVELGERGVRANSISPGPILTGIFGKGAGVDPAEADARAGDLEPLFRSALEQWQPLRRAGTPDDVAPAAVWLASDASRFVNGHDLIVDGGISAGRPLSVSIAERAQMAPILLAAREPETARS